MLVGGRRGGNTHLAVVALVMMMVAVPKSIVWAISPTQEETDELEQAAREILPSSWFTSRVAGAGKSLQFKLANGSRLLFLSGHKPRSLKRGRCDLALLNEGQNMYRATWRQLRGAIADRAGLVVIAANPPDETIGQWIEEVYAAARAGRIDALAFHLVAKHNPFVTPEALEAMRREVDDRTAAKEIDGKMGVPIGDKVFHAWSDDESIRTVPDHYIDITAEVTKRELGKAFGYVLGTDFQAMPHMAAVVHKIFRDPEDPGTEHTFAVDEVIVEKSDEDGLIDALEATPRWKHHDERDQEDTYRGWFLPGDSPTEPVCCAVVADASAWFQDGAHTKGRTSDRAFAARKWTWLYKPQKDSDKNPDIVERMRCTNARLKLTDAPDAPDGTPGKVGKRRLFSCPHNARTNLSMRDWENRNGTPYRRSDHAHVCDCVSYVQYRFYGRPKVKGAKSEYRGLGRFDRASELKGY